LKPDASIRCPGRQQRYIWHLSRGGDVRALSDAGDAMTQSADDRDEAIDARLGTSIPSRRSLDERLYAGYEPGAWGLTRLRAIADEEQRAVASDLILSALEGVQVNVREMALSHLDLVRCIGPNGRTMPGPDTTIDSLIEGKRLHQAITDFARAFGSTIDCLAALLIGILGLRASIQRASGAHLLAMPSLAERCPESQAQAREDLIAIIEAHRSAAPAGWLEWTMELRDAVVGHVP
jgi:hypothetical protein